MLPISLGRGVKTCHFVLRTLLHFFRLCTLFNIAEFDVDDELPEDEEIERRFSTLLVLKLIY